MAGLQKTFDNCIENNFFPKVFVLCGNFTSRSIAHGNSRDIQGYQGINQRYSHLHALISAENFDALADLIASYPLITRGTSFVFVPGPFDLTINSIFPRRPILSNFTARLKSKIPKVHFATNPCRIKFFHQEIVIFREDTMSKLLRNVVGVKPDVRSDDLKKYVRAREIHIYRADTLGDSSFRQSLIRATLPL